MGDDLLEVIDEQRILIESDLAEQLLFGDLVKGGLVKVGIKNGEIDIRIEQPERRIGSKKPPLLTAE